MSLRDEIAMMTNGYTDGYDAADAIIDLFRERLTSDEIVHTALREYRRIERINGIHSNGSGGDDKTPLKCSLIALANAFAE